MFCGSYQNLWQNIEYLDFIFWVYSILQKKKKRYEHPQKYGKTVEILLEIINGHQ